MRLIYFSPVPWDSYEQRPHYFAYDFLASGGTAVDWIDPYPARLPAWRDLARLDSRARRLTLPRPSGLEVHRASGLPIDPLPGGPRVNRRLFWQSLLRQLSHTTDSATVVGVGRPTELAMAACERLPAAWRFYDAMDDFPEFYRGRSRAATAKVESELAVRVEHVIVSSTHLERKFASTGRPLTRIANGYDMALLPPFDPLAVQSAHIGFIGCLGSWLDWEVVVAVAEAVAPAPVTLAGPVAVQPSRTLPVNVRLLPPCSQSEGIALLRTFSAGLIPFKRNALTAGVDPIKYYQYRGMGLPVLTTRFGEMAERTGVDGVFFLEAGDAVKTSIAKAADYHPTAEAVGRARRDDDWRARFRAADVWKRPGQST
jgi:hypothetical protein